MNSYPKDPYEAKYQLLINRHKHVGLREYNDAKVFIEYSNYIKIKWRKNMKTMKK